MRAVFLAVAALLCGAVNAEAPKESYRIFFAPAFGISYPLIFSAGAGAFVPIGKEDPDDAYPRTPGLRADVEVGLGGGAIAAGIYVPRETLALSLKAASLRTWLIPWNQPEDRTYDGLIVELAMFGHMPAKIGLGRFRERARGDAERDELTYLILGVGF